MGGRVYFLVPGWSYHPQVLQELVARGDIDGFSRLSEYQTVGLVNAVSRLFVLSGIRKRMLRSQQQQALNDILSEVQRRDLIVLQQHMYLFAIDELKKRVQLSSTGALLCPRVVEIRELGDPTTRHQEPG
jgi:hypothetical protein